MTKPLCEVTLNEQDVRNYRPLYEKTAGCDRKKYTCTTANPFLS